MIDFDYLPPINKRQTAKDKWSQTVRIPGGWTRIVQVSRTGLATWNMWWEGKIWRIKGEVIDNKFYPLDQDERAFIEKNYKPRRINLKQGPWR